MKVAIDGRAANWYRGTGIGTYTYELIYNLNRYDKKNNYLIFLQESSSLNNFNHNFSIENIQNQSNENFWDKVSIPNILDDTKSDLYHVPQNGVGLSSNINCKKVITLHDIIPLRMPETVSPKYLKIFNNELPNIIKDCDGIITVSNFSKNDIAKEFNYPKNKIFVTHLAAESIYVPLSKNECKHYLRRKYDINNKIILYVGGFSPRKNILGLINAFSLLPQKYRKDTTLVIVGNKGPSYTMYKNQAEKLKLSDSILFPGFIPYDKLPIFYNAAEVLVYPSFYEGFGLPPLEAMACGTPVITSNVTSMKEVVDDAAILIDPYNIDTLKNALEQILTDTKLSLKLMSKGLIRSMDFSWKDTAINTIKCYEQLINGCN